MTAARSINSIDGKYRVLAQLGQGGTADVNLAVARGPSGFSKLVVLKSMRRQFRDEPHFAEMFMVEARLAAQLNHPNIVQTNEVFDFDGLPVIVMEYLEGQPLSAVLGRSKSEANFPMHMHLRVISECLSALEYAHNLRDFEGNDLGLVHRDVSPHNVFLTYDGQVKLLDFGIAKLNTSHVETATGVIKGKLRYMPPEQIVGEGVDHRADLFAIGVMLWEAATRKKMWANASEANIMNAVLNGEIPAPSTAAEDVPEELERIIMKALEPDQDDRYASAADMQAEVDHFLANTGSSLRRRDIGDTVCKLFEENREQTRQIVQDQLSKVVSLSESDVQQFQPIELGHTATGMSSVSQSRTGHGQQSSNRTLLLVAALAILIPTAAFGAWQFAKQQSDANAVQREAPKALTAQATRAEKKEILLRITAFPATAILSLDGKELPSNPYSRLYPQDEKQVMELKIHAPGFHDEVRKIRFDQDADIVVTLREKPKPEEEKAEEPEEEEEESKPVRRWRPRPVVRSPAPAPAPAPAAKADTSCDTPYYIDSRGVKKFKPACL